MLTHEQVISIKQKLIEQIDNSFPEERKEFAKNQIEVMSSEELEKFLIKNNLVQTEGRNQDSCVFCSIVSENIKSYKIAENKKAIAVLEINPLSHGHVIIIPKEHVTSEEEMPAQVSTLSKKVSSMIKSRLKSKRVDVSSSKIMGHEILNLIPFYEDQGDTSERKPATLEELSELQEILKKKLVKRKSHVKKERTLKKIIKEFEEKIWLPKRIP